MDLELIQMLEFSEDIKTIRIAVFYMLKKLSRNMEDIKNSDFYRLK